MKGTLKQPLLTPATLAEKKQSSMNNQITKSELALRFIRDIE